MLGPTLGKDPPMPSRAKIATLVTLVALGALAAVAFASGSGGDPAAVQTQDDQSAPKMRTEIVRQTVHRRANARDSPGRAQYIERAAASAPRPAARAPGNSTGAGAAGEDRRCHGRRGAATPTTAADDHGPAVTTTSSRGRGGDRDDYDDADRRRRQQRAGGGDDDGGGHGRGRNRGHGGDDD